MRTQQRSETSPSRLHRNEVQQATQALLCPRNRCGPTVSAAVRPQNAICDPALYPITLQRRDTLRETWLIVPSGEIRPPEVRLDDAVRCQSTAMGRQPGGSVLQRVDVICIRTAHYF